MNVKDFIVVGSGMSGAHAAQTLVESGQNVAMVDVGHKPNHYNQLVPDQDFVSIRQTQEDQRSYFLGNNFEGFPWGVAKHSLTPPRQFIVDGVDQFLTSKSDDFNFMESLAYGGLGNGWGAGCAAFTNQELEKMSLPINSMRQAYEHIADRIGVSGSHDDIWPFCGEGIESIQKPMQKDNSSSRLLAAYDRGKNKFNKSMGVFLGQTPFAVLTQALADRRACDYSDMEFWIDHGKSVYRPRFTIDALKTNPNFEYLDGLFVKSFKETSKGLVELHCLRQESREEEILTCRKLILGSSALGTARIVLRSFGSQEPVPILTNHYAISPCLHYRMLGTPLDQLKTSMGQLTMYCVDPKHSHRTVSMYTYRSLLLFKLIKEVPLSTKDARRLMHAISSAIVITTTNHPDSITDQKRLKLVADSSSPTGDKLHIDYKLSNSEKSEDLAFDNKIKRAYIALGLIPLTKQKLQHGSSIHYAGTLPFSNNDVPLTQASDGRIHGTQSVYCADSSGFNFLPSNGLTFSIMANAHRVAKGLIAQ